MLSFRQKIFISYVIVFLIFLAFMFPFASHTVHSLVSKVMADRASEIIVKIKEASNDEALIRLLKEQKPLLFFRVSVITDQRKVLYDSHTKRVLGPRFSQEYVVNHPEVLEAFDKGVGYNEEYSQLLGQKFVYIAKVFDFHGKPYILRTAFPYKNVVELIQEFELGFLGLSTAVLLLFSLMTWFIINHLTSPIQQIITAVKPYQEGAQTTIPAISVKSLNRSDEFGKLASTLNSLSGKIQKQINTLTHERNEKEAVLESLIEGVIALDPNMVVTFANNIALNFLNMKADELIGHSFAVTQLHKCYTILAACQAEKKIMTDTLIIKNENIKVYLDIVAAPKKDNTGAILVLQDKSIQYKMLEMRKDFIANASHELKTPITIIRGFAETLHDNPGLGPQLTEEITGKIVRNCQRMTTLVKDLLTLSDIENIPESRLIECDLYEIIDNCCYMLRDAFPDASIKLVNLYKGDIHITGDPSLLDMAFKNLIENAAKYSTPPADITVTMDVIGDKIKVQIADKGIGIPPADLEHIFERFYTVNKAYSLKMGGSGLGLSIVENIITKHFGKITVASKVGEGTTFTITFPTIPA